MSPAPLLPHAPKAVLFDCDGVIVDSELMTFEMLVEDFARYGLHTDVAGVERDFIGGTIEKIFPRARAAGAALPDDWVADFYARLYARLGEGVPLIPGIMTAFAGLDAAGVPFAVGSNGSEAKMQISLGQHGLTPRFKVILSGQAIGAPKPAPDVYLMAAAACGVAPEDCVVIEDSPTGARAAIAAGIPCLGFATHGLDSLPARGLAELGLPRFTNMAELPALLGLTPR